MPRAPSNLVTPLYTSQSYTPVFFPKLKWFYETDTRHDEKNDSAQQAKSWFCFSAQTMLLIANERPDYFITAVLSFLQKVKLDGLPTEQ